MTAARTASSYVGPALAFVAALLLGGWMLLGPNDARDQAAAVHAGTAPSQTARLDSFFYDPARTGWYDHVRGTTEWLAHLVDPEAEGNGRISRYVFNVPGKGEVLEKWDGATVTAYLAEGRVIGVKLPDDSVLTSDKVGWYGSATHILSGLFAIAVALLIGATRLRMGFLTGLVGGLLMALTLLAAVHLGSLLVGLVVDAVLLVAVVFLVVWALRKAKEAPPAETPTGGG